MSEFTLSTAKLPFLGPRTGRVAAPWMPVELRVVLLFAAGRFLMLHPSRGLIRLAAMTGRVDWRLNGWGETTPQNSEPVAEEVVVG